MLSFQCQWDSQPGIPVGNWVHESRAQKRDLAGKWNVCGYQDMIIKARVRTRLQERMLTAYRPIDIIGTWVFREQDTLSDLSPHLLYFFFQFHHMLTAVLENPKNNFKSELRTAEDSLQRRKQNPFCRHLGPTTALDAATDFNNHVYLLP